MIIILVDKLLDKLFLLESLFFYYQRLIHFYLLMDEVSKKFQIIRKESTFLKISNIFLYLNKVWLTNN